MPNPKFQMETDLKKLTPDIRHLNDMRSVIYDQEWLTSAENLKLYYMYRGIEENNDIRYDITVVPAKMLGEEFIKTKGHYHIGKYQEIYTVLEGQAIYLMQKKKNGAEDEIEDAYAVKCRTGDVIVIPPDYGHITINPSETEELKIANWISKDCKSDYSLFEKLRGACYYYLTSGWIKNGNYKFVAELRFEKTLKEVPKNLDFLKVK